MYEISTDRVVGIIVALIIGIILSFLYEKSLWMFEFNVESLVVYITIPALSGFVLASMEKSPKVSDSLFIGFIVGAINVMIGFAVAGQNAFIGKEALSVLIFALISLFSWMLVSGVGAILAKQAKK